jgi:hypothetical protein
MIWVISLLVLIALLVIWIYTSVHRGATKRDEQILKRIEPLTSKLDAGEEVTIGDVRDLAQTPQVRFLLFAELQRMGKGKLFPNDFDSEEKQAEASLTYWMMHPNELGTAPEKMEHFKTIERNLQESKGRFYFFRYLMPEGHWARKDGWILGFSGPFMGDENPYEYMSSAFSRATDKADETDPQSILDWYLDKVKLKRDEI